MTRIEKYNSINKSKIPKEVADEFDIVVELSEMFQDESEKQLMQNFDDLYKIVQSAYPDAIQPKKMSEIVKANPSRVMVVKPAAKVATKRKKKYSKPVLKKATEAQIKASKLKKAEPIKEKLKFNEGDHVEVIKYNWHMVVDKIVFDKETKKYMIFLEPYKYAEKAGNPGSYLQEEIFKLNFKKRKASLRPKVSKPKVSDTKKKEAKYSVLLKKIAEYKEQLKDNDKAKNQIAEMAKKQYAEIDAVKSLGRTKMDVDYEKAVSLHKLYREFLTADKRKFKGIKDRAEGKGRVSKPKTLGKAKPKRKPAPKKNWLQRLFS